MIRAGSVRRSASSAPAGIPARDAIRVASSSSGRRPGVIKSLGHAQDPRAGSAPAATAGSSPARSSDDLPDPDGPSTIKHPWPGHLLTSPDDQLSGQLPTAEEPLGVFRLERRQPWVGALRADCDPGGIQGGGPLLVSRWPRRNRRVGPTAR